MPKFKSREEFEGGLHEKRKGKGGEKKKKVIKHTLKYLYEVKKYFSGWPEYTPL